MVIDESGGFGQGEIGQGTSLVSSGAGGAAPIDPKMQIEYLRDRLLRLLVNDGDCLSYLSRPGSRANALGILTTVPINPGKVSIGDAETTATPSGQPYLSPPTNPSITVNNQSGSYFFTKGLGTDVYGNRTGTDRYQGATLLHELAHATGAAFPDGDNDPMMGKNGGIDPERLNNDMVQKRCKKTLSSLSNK